MEDKLFTNNAVFSSRDLYLAGHIPQAIHADLDVAMYPSQYQRYTYYPPHIFEQYVQVKLKIFKLFNFMHIFEENRSENDLHQTMAKFSA